MLGQPLTTRRAPCLLIDGRRPRCAQMPASQDSLVRRCRRASDCEPGYCDESAGQCICPPGWGGSSCEWHFLSACRVREGSQHMTCHGFGGVMSCDCLDQCVVTMGASSVLNKICFERTDGELSTTSDMPTNTSSIRFLAPSFVLALDHASIGDQWQDVPLDRPIFHRRSWRTAKQLIPRGVMPLPNAQCPLSCSDVGTCLGDAVGLQPQCQCHDGFFGRGCEHSNLSFCLNRCNARGRCAQRICLCDLGFFGADCSLRRTESLKGSQRFAPMYVYPLPSEWSSQFVSPLQPNLFSAASVFIELLHKKRDAIVDDPEAAVLFFVPVIPVNIGSNLWDPRRFLDLVVTYLSGRHPYWNRTGGADHVFFTTQESPFVLHTALHPCLCIPSFPTLFFRTWAAVGPQHPCTAQSSSHILVSLRAKKFG